MHTRRSDAGFQFTVSVVAWRWWLAVAVVVARTHSNAIKITKNKIQKIQYGSAAISIFFRATFEPEGQCLTRAAAALFKVINVKRHIKISQKYSYLNIYQYLHTYVCLQPSKGWKTQLQVCACAALTHNLRNF